MKANLRRIAALLVCASALFSLAVFSACNKDGGGNTPKPDGGSELSEAQRANILAISEAFIESGKVYNSEYALTVREIEQFIYYLYNDELKPESDGYAKVSGTDSAERLKMYFGIANLLHTQKNSGDQDFYYANGTYFVKTNSPVVTSAEIVSVKLNENGNREVLVKAVCADDARVELDFVFKLEGDDTLVLSCTRYDEK